MKTTSWQFMANLLEMAPEKRPRCPACGGETVPVMVRYGSNNPVPEWECIICSKSFRADRPIRYSKSHKHRPFKVARKERTSTSSKKSRKRQKTRDR